MSLVASQTRRRFDAPAPSGDIREAELARHADLAMRAWAARLYLQ